MSGEKEKAQSSSATASASTTSGAISSAATVANSPPSHSLFEVGKGINGLNKIILRDPRGFSAEVQNQCRFIIPFLLYGFLIWILIVLFVVSFSVRARFLFSIDSL